MMTMTFFAPRWLLVLLCGVAMLFYAVYLGAVGVLLPRIGATFGLGAEAQGRLFPATFAGFVLGVSLCGFLSDRFGRKAVLLAGLAGYILGLLLFGGASLYPAALLAAALIGAGSGAMEVVASALAADLFPERRASLLNALQVAFGVGAAAAPLLCRALLSIVDWRALYLGLGALNAALFVAFALCRVPQKSASEKFDAGAARRVVRQRAFVLLCIMQVLYVGGEIGFFSWLPTHFERTLSGGAALAGWVGACFWLAMTLGRFLLEPLLGRFPLMRLCGIAAAGGALFSLLALLAGSASVALCLVALTGFFLAGIFSLILAEAGERYAFAAGTAFSGVVAAGGVGGALIPYLIGALADTPLGLHGALYAIPLSLALLALLSLLVRR